jgi:heat shock protein HspQ
LSGRFDNYCETSSYAIILLSWRQYQRKKARMTKGKMKIGEISKPRFEFRTFGIDLSETTARMVELSMPVPEHVKVRHSDEVYVISKTNDTNNTRIYIASATSSVIF